LHRYNHSLHFCSAFISCVFLYSACTGNATKPWIILKERVPFINPFLSDKPVQHFMTRYDPTPPSQSKSLESLDVNLTPQSSANSSNLTSGNLTTNLTTVRPRLTSSPQTILTDFRLHPTTYGLEIRLPLNRIKGSLMSAATKIDDEAETQLHLAVIVGTTLLVGGSVALSGSAIFGAIVAALLPIIFWGIVRTAKPKDERKATLRLVNTPNGNTLLSLSSTANTHSLRRVIYASNLPVKLVSAKTTFFGTGQVSFTVYANSPHEANQLCIQGNQQEVRWLHARIAQWGRGGSKP
jgi:hypothetical protein